MIETGKRETSVNVAKSFWGSFLFVSTLKSIVKLSLKPLNLHARWHEKQGSLTSSLEEWLVTTGQRIKIIKEQNVTLLLRQLQPSWSQLFPSCADEYKKKRKLKPLCASGWSPRSGAENLGDTSLFLNTNPSPLHLSPCSFIPLHFSPSGRLTCSQLHLPSQCQTWICSTVYCRLRSDSIFHRRPASWSNHLHSSLAICLNPTISSPFCLLIACWSPAAFRPLSLTSIR